ncbi:alpha/beta fold hydrolase [Mycobacterium sherrisii]|uniref:alpha/beta fold hydrolase n=1 Tax=Mycobacterium sherrisii TaxID=243061 RepID=UPI00398E5E6F
MYRSCTASPAPDTGKRFGHDRHPLVRAGDNATTTVLRRTADLKVACEVSGSVGGRPLVALHGWPDTPHCWDGVLPALHDDGYRVFRPWLRGFGSTRFRRADKPRSGQIGALGKDLADLLDALAVDDAVVVGHDWVHAPPPRWAPCSQRASRGSFPAPRSA